MPVVRRAAIPPARYFLGTSMLFERACARTGVVTGRYAVGGHVVCVRSAGTELFARTDPALARPWVPEPSDGPDLVVEMWDSEVSGVPIGRAPWPREAVKPLGLVDPLCTDRFLTAVDFHTASLSVFDREARVARFWLEDARRMAYWQSASPLRLILSWWASTRGLQLTHAAAVTGAAGAVLLAGGAGAGKSTTALTCLAAGLGFLGDDYCLVGVEPEPTVHRVYSTAKLRPDAFERLPALLGLARNADRLPAEKAVLDLAPAYASQLVESAPIRAIAIPRVTGRFARRPATPGAVLRALAPSTVFGLFGATPTTLPLLARVARSVPGYVLELGDDVEGVVDAVAALAG